MSHFVEIRQGMSNAGEKQVSNLAVAFCSAGVVGTNDYLVQAQGSPNNTVLIGTGRAYVPTSDGTMNYSTLLDATQNVTISANTSGNARIDCIVLYIDLSASVDANADNVAKFADVQGTPSGSPVAPNNAAILTAIGSSNPYIILANLAVANGFTSITSGNITDERTTASLSGSATGLKTTSTTVAVSAASAPTAGQVLTATSGTAANWQNLPSATSGVLASVQQATSTTGSTSSTSYVDAGISVTFTPAATANILVELDINWYNGGVQSNYAIVQLDGVTQGFDPMVNVDYDTASKARDSSACVWITGVSAAAHTIKVQWKTSGSTLVNNRARLVALVFNA